MRPARGLRRRLNELTLMARQRGRDRSHDLLVDAFTTKIVRQFVPADRLFGKTNRRGDQLADAAHIERPSQADR